MLNMVAKVFEIFYTLLKIPLVVFAVIFIIFLILVLFNLILLAKQGRKIPKANKNKVKKPSILKRIFILAPKMYADDIVSRDPDFFDEQGLIVYCGRQGAGKTISAIHMARELVRKYPKSLCISNTDFAYQNESLDDWKMLIDYKNGKKGVVVVMDELQNWFSSAQSRNFPPEMLSVITQNRKNRRIILSTAQSFFLLAKPIRSQVTEVRDCFTLFGCITFVKRKIPILDADGQVIEWKKRGIYFYVHDKDLRESYDTYSVIENLSASGFVEKDKLLNV